MSNSRFSVRLGPECCLSAWRPLITRSAIERTCSLPLLRSRGNRRMRTLVNSLLCSATSAMILAIASDAGAGPITAGTTYLPLNPGPTFTIHGVSGIGTIAVDRGTQAGNTIPIIGLSGGQFYGAFSGPYAFLGSYVFGNVPPLTGTDFTGSLTNVVQNPDSSFKSGDFTFGGNSFGFEFLTGPYAGITLFTDSTVPFQFGASIDGLPPSPGTVLESQGNDVLPVLFGPYEIATSENRTIVLSAVPEPSSFGLLFVGGIGLGLGGYHCQRRTSAA